MPKRILTVGCEIPSENAESVSLKTRSSLLDADIGLILPGP